MRKYELEIRKLKYELDEKNRTIIDKGRVLQLEEDKKKAEQDRVAAMAALEARSREFFVERDEKRKLEDKIRMMYSQMLVGGCKIVETPAFKNALEEQQKLIREQYEKKLADLERERNQIEEDKAQVDRYKQLLLKQRDIMIALTSRLNERDETIIQLQEELDAYDRIHRETEEMLEIHTSRIKQLESVLKENGISLPKEVIPPPRRMMGGQMGGNNQAADDSNFICDVVTYDGQETFNISNNSMLTPAEKIEQLSRMANDQKLEILKLKHQLANKDHATKQMARKPQNNNEINSPDEMQLYYENEIEQLQDQIQMAEDTHRKMCDTMSKLGKKSRNFI